MEKVTRKRFYKNLDLSKAKEIYSDSKVCILLYDGVVYKSVQIGDWNCEVSIDCKEVTEGREDTEFFMSI